MNLYDRVVEAVIMLAVLFEAIVSWKLLQVRQRQTITRRFRRLVSSIGLSKGH